MSTYQMNRKIKMKLASLVKAVLALTFFMWSQIVGAATYNVTISGAHTANLTLTAGAPGAPSIVTAVSGTFDGQTVTGLNNLCYASNVINSTGLGFVDYGGISVTYGSGSDYVNLWFDDGNPPNPPPPGRINIAQVNCGPYDSVTSSASILDLTPVPTLSEWAMIIMASLIGMFAFMRLRKS